MLEASDEIEVVGQAEDTRTAVAEVAALLPDIVLLDLQLARLGRHGGHSRDPERCARCKIIVFTMYDNPAFVWETVNLGAAGYLLKTASREELLHAIRCVASGAGYLQAAVTMPVLKRVAHDARSSGSRRTLTQRELQVLEALADGLPSKIIAHRMTLSEETIKSHLRSLYEKLGAADRAHAVSIALRQRLIE